MAQGGCDDALGARAARPRERRVAVGTRRLSGIHAKERIGANSDESDGFANARLPKPRFGQIGVPNFFNGYRGANSRRYRISTPTLKKRLAAFVGVAHPPSVSISRP